MLQDGRPFSPLKTLAVNKHFLLPDFMCHILFRLRFINAAGEKESKGHG